VSRWRYVAVPAASPSARLRHGTMAGDSAAEVRALLRRGGLVVVDLRPQRERPGGGTGGERLLSRWRRGRRRGDRAEFHDSLATLLGAGLPLLEALEAMRGDAPVGSGGLLGGMSWRRARMIGELCDGLRGGASLSGAMAAHPAWFDPTELAMVEAAQRSGTLPAVLRDLAERHEHGASIGQKLASALAYPCVLSAVGVAVAIFLGSSTLPELSRLLADAGLEVPGLTVAVIAVVDLLVRFWWLLPPAGIVAVGAAWWLVRRGRGDRGRGLDRLLPRPVRRLALAAAVLRLSELVRTGVPLVEALRVLAPTVGGVCVGLRIALLRTADLVERGSGLAEALEAAERPDGEGDAAAARGVWFEAELRRLVEVGEAGGELDGVLERLGRRYERSSRRLIDRVASMAEPVVILMLAVLVGVVVMAAVLPLVRLQEVLG
jgi:type II secretory pathway component PulF